MSWLIIAEKSDENTVDPRNRTFGSSFSVPFIRALLTGSEDVDQSRAGKMVDVTRRWLSMFAPQGSLGTIFSE